VVWRLPAHGELRLPFSWRGICPGVNCSAQKGVTIFWDVVLIGTDDDGRPVRVAFEFMPPLPEDISSGPAK
jgi:hypothetical protein